MPYTPHPHRQPNALYIHVCEACSAAHCCILLARIFHARILGHMLHICVLRIFRRMRHITICAPHILRRTLIRAPAFPAAGMLAPAAPHPDSDARVEIIIGRAGRERTC
jgi:hypothetical protein